MPRMDDYARMWRPDAGLSPKITPRATDPRIVEVNAGTDPRDIVPEIADALAIGEEAIVLGRADGRRSMVCRALPLRHGVLIITPVPRDTGLRPHIGAAIADAARMIVAEFDHRG